MVSDGLKLRLREYGLTVGTMGSNAAQTLMVVLLPVLLARYAPSVVLIGVVIGSEGLLAIAVPYWIGHLSDHLPERLVRRVGRRAFFLWLAAPLMALSLAIAPFAKGFWPLAAAGVAFFIALQGYVTPLWALMIDSVPEKRRGEVQGVRGVFQAVGLAVGLIVGGLLFALWEPLPFLLVGFVLLASTWLTVLSAPQDRSHAARASDRQPVGAIWRRLFKKPEIRWFLVANGLWTGAVDGIRPFIFLYGTVVLGVSIAESSGLLAILLVGVGIGAILVGRLGDSIGRPRVLAFAAILCGLAMCGGFFVREVKGIVPLLAIAGFAAAAFIALPFPVFAKLAGDEAPGRQTAFFMVSVGVARLLAPIIIGAVIDITARYNPELEGYHFMWLGAGAMSLAAAPALFRAVAHARRGGGDAKRGADASGQPARLPT